MNNTPAHNERARITARVIKVIDDRELLIDAGPVDGVELGMRFAIRGETEVDAPRTATGKLMVPFTKTVVKIVRFVDQNHSIGRTFRMIRGTPAKPSSIYTTPGFTNLRSLVEGTPATPDRVETLQHAQGATLLDGIPQEARRIMDGDDAEETWGDENT